MAFPPTCVRARSFTLTMVTNAQRQVSPYSFAQTSYDFMGGMWRASLELYSMSQRDRATFLRWLASLNGPSIAFEMKTLDYAGPFGTVLANVTVAAAAPVRDETVVLTVNSGESLVADDRITIGGHLHVITEATPSVGVEQTVKVWPRLRAPVAIADPVEVAAPYGTWVLANSENAISVSRDFEQTATLDLIEAI